MYLDAEHEDGYYRHQSVFGDGVSIGDTMGVLVSYQSGAIMTYSLEAYCEWEGSRVCINGTGGRLEMDVLEESSVNAGEELAKEGAVAHKKITVHPMFTPPYEALLVEDLFGMPVPDRLCRAASHVDGAMSILTGIAADKAIRTGQVVQMKDPVHF